MCITRLFSRSNLLISMACWVVLGFAPLGAAAQKLDLVKRLATSRNHALAAGSAAVPLAATPNSASAQYQFVTFSMPGAPATGAIGINDARVVVAYWSDAIIIDLHGLLWHDGVLQPLDDPAFASTGLTGINDAGVVTAGVGPSQYVQSAALYDLRRGGWTLLPDFQGLPLNNADEINNAGIVVGGGCDTGNVNCVGWTWDGHQYSSFTVPGSDAAAGGTTALSINDRDQIVGTYVDSNAVTHGYLKDGDQYTTIDVPGAGITIPLGINDRGDIVGVSLDAAFAEHGFLLRNGQFATIDYPGAVDTTVDGINAQGDIVGQWNDATGIGRAFVGTRRDE